MSIEYSYPDKFTLSAKLTYSQSVTLTFKLLWVSKYPDAQVQNEANKYLIIYYIGHLYLYSYKQHTLWDIDIRTRVNLYSPPPKKSEEKWWGDKR